MKGLLQKWHLKFRKLWNAHKTYVSVSIFSQWFSLSFAEIIYVKKVYFPGSFFSITRYVLRNKAVCSFQQTMKLLNQYLAITVAPCSSELDSSLKIIALFLFATKISRQHSWLPTFWHTLYRAVNPHIFKYWELIGKEWQMTSYRMAHDFICAKNNCRLRST